MSIAAIPDITAALSADGVNRLWDFSFAFQSKDHIRVYVYNALGVRSEISSNLFSVTDPGDAGGVVTYPIAPVAVLASPFKVRVGRVVPYDQPSRIGNQGAFYPETHEDAFDYLSMQIQHVAARLARTFYLPDYPDPAVTVFELPFPAAGYALVWGANGLENSSLSLDDLGTLLTNVEASAELALGYAAMCVNVYQTVVDLVASYASGGSTNNALLVTYAGDWAAINVADALDEAKAAHDVDAANVTALQASVVALQAAVVALQAGGIAVPIGATVAFWGGSVPTGWALMYGQTVGKAGSGAALAGPQYEPLFNVLGGSLPNDGTEVFATGGVRHIPDMRGRAIIGRDDMGGSAAARVRAVGTGNPGLDATVRGNAGGVDRHATTVAQMPLHGHPYRVGGGNDHNDFTGGLTMDAAGVSNLPANTAALGSAAGLQIGGTGGGQAHPNVQPSAVADWIICIGV